MLRNSARGGGKRIAVQLRLDPKTVRRYVDVGEAHGILSGGGPEQLTEAVARVERAVRDVRDDCFGGEWVRDPRGAAPARAE